MANQELVKAIKVGGVVTSLGELANGDSITMKGDTGAGGKITFNNAANNNGTTLQVAHDAGTSATFTLPSAVGTAGQVLSVTSASGTTNVLGFSADSGITSVSADSSPVLGGNLDVGSNSITSASASGVTVSTSAANGNITFTPHGTGKVLMDGDGSTTGVIAENGSLEIKSTASAASFITLHKSNDNTDATKLQSGAPSGAITVTLPAATTTLVGTDTTDTLTNKTLTAPVITSVTSGGIAITFPSSARQTLAGLAEDQIFTGGIRGSVTANTAESLTFDLAVTNNFTASISTGTQPITFSNAASAVGQSGNIILTTSGTYTVGADSTTKIASGTSPDGGLGTINAAAGVYWLSSVSYTHLRAHETPEHRGFRHGG